MEMRGRERGRSVLWVEGDGEELKWQGVLGSILKTTTKDPGNGNNERNAFMLTRGPSCCNQHESTTSNSSSIFTTTTLRNFLAFVPSTYCYLLPFIIMIIALLIIYKKNEPFFVN